MNRSALETLYPNLKAQPEASEQELLTSIERKARDSREVKDRFFQEQGEVLMRMAKSLARCFSEGGTLWTAGNGGSSCDAAHVAVEFSHPVTVGRPALPAHHIGADVPFLTALSNDVGFDNAFARRLEGSAKAGDALVTFSTSGNSENLVRALGKARELGMLTLGFLGGDGGRMKSACQLSVVVPTFSIHRIQECHVTSYHILWDIVHTILAQHRGGD